MATATQHVTKGTSDRKQIKIVQHSQLFYWWPVWAFGFLLGGMTYVDGGRMLILPAGSKIEKPAEDQQPKNGMEEYPLLVPARKSTESLNETLDRGGKPFLHMSDSKNFGILWAIVLILVIVSTNVPLRGMWSVVIIMMIILLSIILYLLDWWRHVINFFDFLHIHINAGGYFFISTALFVIWLVTFLFFDPQVYMVFTPGQFKVRQEIGGGEMAYDTMGMVIQKQRDDLFRHWILGLGGSGDLIVRTAGAHSHEFHMQNVLFVGWKLQQIEEMQRDRPVVRGD